MRHWRSIDTQLRITEHETVFAEAPLVEDVGIETWEALGLKVSRLLGDPDGLWRITADRYVGVARLSASAEQPVHLRIQPKLAADVFFLADYAFGATRDLLSDRHLAAELDAIREDPAACLLAWFFSDLEAFALRWLRRSYVRRREILNGRARGRLLLGEYANQYVATAQSQRVPCEFFDLSPDNLANQVLKAALRHAARLSVQVPLPAAQHALRRSVSRVEPYFSAIATRQINRSDFNRLQLVGSMRHYQPMIAKSRAVLEGLFLSEELGPHVQNAFLWDASVLFQEAIRGALRTGFGRLVVDRRPAKAVVVDAGGAHRRGTKVDPDYVIDLPEGFLILDAKYKEVGQRGGPEDAEVEVRPGIRIRISRHDIYQAVSYGQHDLYKPAVSGLTYPITLEPHESLPPPYRVMGFGQPVWLVFFDVGTSARENMASFFSLLRLIAAQQEPV